MDFSEPLRRIYARLDSLDEHAQETGDSLMLELATGIRCYVNDIAREVDYLDDEE